MSRGNARMSPGNRKSSEPSRHPWQERADNKRQKKRIVQGEATSSSGRTRRRSKSAKKAQRTEQPASAISSLLTSFSDVDDPRINRRRRHVLSDIIIIAVLATIANADSWKEMNFWGEANKQWLATFLELPNGIPSRDTFRRTISRLNPEQFQKAFLTWLGGITQGIEGIVAIDGKTLRRSGTKDKGPLHIVSAWAAEQHLTLGQRTVDGKSNEITAIPQLLASLALQGAIVTIDAMGCQKNIAAQIVEAHADYCLAVKDNQPKLFEDIVDAFVAAIDDDFQSVNHDSYESHDTGHGRCESRYYDTMDVPDTFRTADEWKGIKSIGRVVTFLGPEADCDGDVRYYINSFASDAKRFATAVRSHWGIENSLHWVMDVTFGEDGCRIHKDHGAENVSWLRRLAISLIKRDTSAKDTISGKRSRAGYDQQFFKQMLASISEQT